MNARAEGFSAEQHTAMKERTRARKSASGRAEKQIITRVARTTAAKVE